MMGDAGNPDAVLAAAGAATQALGAPVVRQSGRVVGKLRLLSLEDVRKSPPRNYILPGLIAPGEFSVWWGAPKCGKSFLLLRLAFGLAMGRGMWGREPARPVRVLYGAAEGESGLKARLDALERELGHPGANFAAVAQRMQLGAPGEHLADMIAASRIHRAELVIVDTLARTFGDGDEYHPKDMGAYVQAMDQLREEGREKGAPAVHVAVIHHGSKDEEAKTPRGSGALLGAADLVVRIKKGTPHTATVEMAKDDAEGDELPFRLRALELPAAIDGTPSATCIAEEAEAGGGGNNAKKLTGQAARALGFLTDLILQGGNILPASEKFPPHADLRGVPFEDWRKECASRSLSTSSEKRAVNKAFQAASEALLAGGFIATAMDEDVKIVWQAKGAGT